MNTENAPSIFEVIRERYSFKEIAEHYIGEEFIPDGAGYQLESKSCPTCGHNDCFKARRNESGDGINLITCFSCGLSASDAPSLLTALRPGLNNYQAAEIILQDAQEHGFSQRLDMASVQRDSPVSKRQVGIISPTERQQAILDSAKEHYVQSLEQSSIAMRYQTETRHHSPEILIRNGVGLSTGQLLPYLKRNGFTFTEATASGLVRETGSDFFSSGLYVYAHMDKQGRTCHFTMKDPDNNLQYQLPKKHQLRDITFFGQHTLAQPNESRKIVLCEGENDWLSIIESGCPHPILAFIGQPSSHQISWLSEEFIDFEILTFFDTDDAGNKYREKMASALSGNLKQYVLPEKDSDPDEFLKSGLTFEEMIQACSLWSAPERTTIYKAEAPSSVDFSESLNPENFPNTDLGNADLFKVISSGQLLFIREHNSWAWFDGSTWKFHHDHMALKYARLVSAVRMKWAGKMPSMTEAQGKAKDRSYTYALGCQDQKRLNPLLSLASKDHELIHSVTDFDNDPYLLGVKNGVVNLKTGELLSNSASLMLSKQCPGSYYPNRDNSLWIDVITKALDEGDREETKKNIDYLQKVFGMALIGEVLERALFFIHGKPGTGKSLVTNTVQHVLGDYALPLSSYSLMQSSYQSNDNKMPEIVRLRGVRFALAPEADDKQHFNESLLKSITGSDIISARDLGEKSIYFKPQCTLFIVANSRPSGNGSPAFWERLKVISFNNQVPKNKQDPHMASKLIKDADGILSWMIQGCLAYQETGLIEPAAVIRDSANYRADLDVLAQFMEENCIIDSQAKESAQEIYHRYKEWIESETGAKPLGRNRFHEKMQENDFTKTKTRMQNVSNPIWAFHGLKLKAPH